MRYHRAKALSKPEADRLIGQHVTALSDVVVVSRGDRFYDVRSMTNAEIQAFVADLARSEYAELEAAAMLPC
jgi:hypothetical protein